MYDYHFLKFFIHKYIYGKILWKGRDMRLYKLLVLDEPNTPYSEQFRNIALNILSSLTNEKCNIIQITSSDEGEGKTQFISNLGCIFATKGLRVLLVDTDLRKSKLHHPFKLVREPGLTNILNKEVTIKEATQTFEHEKIKIDLIASGSKVSSTDVLIGSLALKNLLNELRNDYDVILCDSSPVLLTTDALELTRLCDSTVFLIKYNKTKKSEIKRSINNLKENGSNVIGTVFTNVNDSYSKYNGIRQFSKKYYRSYKEGSEKE
jgi:capsular exopolysaccharide synthesis family protein